MKNRAFRWLAGTVILLLAGVVSCKKNEEPKPEPADTFDRTGLLQNYSQQLIIPSYAALNNQLDTLVTDVNAFIVSPNLTTLATLRNTFKRSYKRWMHCSPFEFGPAYDALLRASVNTFPCDTPQVNLNIANGTYDLFTAANIDAIGYPALDFLLYGTGTTDAAILNRYTTDPQAASRKTYLQDVTSNLKYRINQVYSAWINSYASAFQSNTASSTASPLSNIVNQLNYDYELTKNARVGIPLGKQSLGVLLPEKCEALYSGYSLTLIKEHINVIENFYLGRNEQGINGKGLDDYLDYLGAQYNGNSLNNVIQTKFAEIKTAVNAIPEELSQSVVMNTAVDDAAYIKLQELILFLKTDMPSALSIMITYVDADGD